MLLPRRKLKRLLITMLLPFLLTLTILTPFYIIYKPPTLLIRYFQHLWPDTLWHVPLPPAQDRKLIALTIDDAPSSYTPEIRSLLATNSATATFFLIGSQIPGREAELHELVRGQNELANHAMHDEPSRALSDEELRRQVGVVQDRIRAAYSAVGVREPRQRWFRPGSGFFSERMRAILGDLGYRVVLGSVYPHDAQVKFWWVNARHILSMVRPGSIIICHDRREWTVPMLKLVLPELKRRGYEIVTVSELLRVANGEDSTS
ncbi:putative polysaccharide deacetylase [Aspergillus avenaceus]|uniref:chitin deacetylase n=1 Tax=Aspergillus avenaceus TaxID=36643 RepID=A0A5N6TS21_ASPAV|nr:putative polysaccharide deacetylase [Aspergillus avenaceus]